MPCRDGGPSCEPEPSLKKRLDDVTAMLCDVLERIENADSDGVALIDLPRETQEWWDAHLEADRKRRIQEKDAREAKKLALKNQISNLKKQLQDIE